MEGANCAQATFAAFCDLTGMEESAALRLSAPFGGGLGRQRQLCGAVSGISMVLGALYATDDYKDPGQKAAIYELEQELCRGFLERFGSLNCGELLKPHLETVTDTPTPDARDAAYYKQRPCLLLVEEAVRILEVFLADHPVQLSKKLTIR